MNMREFKFRAWDTEKQEMATVNFIGLNDYEVGMEDEECRRWRATYPYVCRLMQYTNLKDKNGKEIYEGDILKVKLDDGEANLYVKYTNGEYRVVNEGKWEDSLYSYMYFGDVEIVGNIYENKDLII
jgi:uncharacterized phage protein (TIGR01671 family)